MPQTANPRKSFNFDVEIDGIISAEVQKFQHPETSIEQVTHGDANYEVKTPGMVATSNAILEKLKPADNPDLGFWGWLITVQNTASGTGGLPSVIKQIVTVREKAPTGLTINTWTLVGAWPTKVSNSDQDRTASENSMETVELSVDRVFKV